MVVHVSGATFEYPRVLQRYLHSDDNPLGYCRQSESFHPPCSFSAFFWPLSSIYDPYMAVVILYVAPSAWPFYSVLGAL